MLLNVRLKIRDFFRRNKYKVVIALAIFLIIITINYALKYTKTPILPKISYQPHESIMDSKESVPNEMIDPIEKWVDQFITACNQKEYETAYHLLSLEYQNHNSFEDFKKYVDSTFATKKIYVLQNYSNQKNIYLYRIKIMEDIMATGLNGKDDLEYIDEFVTVKKVGKELCYSIGNQIATENLNKVFENEHMKITVEKRIIEYDQEIYTVKIVNKTDYTIVLNNYYNSSAISLDLNGNERVYKGETEIIALPESTTFYDFNFTKFFDDGRTAKSLKFTAIRIFEEYNGLETDENAIRKYSCEINL